MACEDDLQTCRRTYPAQLSLSLHLANKISGISGIPQKIFEILATPKISPICTLTLRTDQTFIEMAAETSPVLWWPPKNIHKIFIPPKTFICLKTPKNIEIENFESPKMVPAYVYMKISEYPPPLTHTPGAATPTKHSLWSITTESRTKILIPAGVDDSLFIVVLIVCLFFVMSNSSIVAIILLRKRGLIV